MKQVVTLLVCCAVLISACSIIPPTPKQPPARFVREVSESTRLAPLVAVVPEDTNSVFYLPLGWTYDGAVNLQAFKIHYGSQPGVYTNSFLVPPTTSYEIWKTNWSEQYVRHYYVVSAVDVLGRESGYSNEAHYPPYPDDHYTVSWIDPSPATLLVGQFLGQWATLAQSSQGQTNYTDAMPSPTLFFRLRRANGPPDTLAVKTFNPLNY